MYLFLPLADALDSTSGAEREKMLALLEALKSSDAVTYENSYLPSSPSPTISPRAVKPPRRRSSRKSKPKHRRAFSENSAHISQEQDDLSNQEAASSLPGRDAVSLILLLCFAT